MGHLGLPTELGLSPVTPDIYRLWTRTHKSEIVRTWTDFQCLRFHISGHGVEALQLKPYRWIELNVNSIRPIKSIIPSSIEWAKCQPRNTKNGGTILPIANLMTDTELVSPGIGLWSISLRFGDNRVPDGRTMQTITILAPTVWAS